MKKAQLIVAIVVAVIGLSLGTYAQSTVVGPVTSPAVKIDFADQPDCPLRLSVSNITLTGSFSVPIQVLNTGDRPVRGFVIVTAGTKMKYTYSSIHPGKPVEQGKFALNGIATRGETTVTLHVDYVLFADGTTWGADQYGRSKIIADYLEGHDLAISRLQELLSGADPTDFIAATQTFGSYTVSGPIFPDRQIMGLNERQRGYNEVLTTLRRMPKRTAEAQEIARKLELMETPN